MALTEVDICNMALGRIGIAAITALADSTPAGVACTLHYAQTRDELLRRFPWRFATRWLDMPQDARTDYGTSTGEDTTTTVNDTEQEWDEDEYDGYYLWITGGTGANQIREIASNTDTEITVTAAFTTTTDTTSTYEIWENYPPYPWAYQYDLPSDFIRFSKTDPPKDLFEISGSLFKSDASTMLVSYVRQVTDPTEFDTLFTQTLVVTLAAKLCMQLCVDKVLTDRLQLESDRKLLEAKLVHRHEIKDNPTEQTWLEARSGWTRTE